MSLMRDALPAGEANGHMVSASDEVPSATKGTRRKKEGNWLRRALQQFRRNQAHLLDEGLDLLHHQLGFHESEYHVPDPNTIADFHVAPTEACPRSIFYAPNMDGQVDPGEVVWFWVPDERAEAKLAERALVVVGRHGNLVMGLITSPNPMHALSEKWIDIGAGPWDDAGRKSWLRLDKIIKVPETAIRRQGAVIPLRRFHLIANRLRTDYGWA